MPCGWPGHTCEMECEFTIQWNSVGAEDFNVGTYRLRNDLRDVRPPFPVEYRHRRKVAHGW
jgi:hypothetical protein